MNLHTFRKISVVFAAALVLISPRIWAEENFATATALPGPEWLRADVIYEIFPRDFSPAGNLNGVTAQLDELKKLGVTILWLMPIQPIGEKLRKGDFGSPYAISDYYAVDPNYGTLDDVKRLVAQAHQRGMKVIMDLVADHTAWDSVMMKHPEFYKHDASGRIVSPMPDWTDVAALNYGNRQLRDYMIAMMQYWVQTCDIDGYRCDSASMVPTDFWVEARGALEKVKPDILLLAEASKPELLVKAFDIDYSWPLLRTLDRVLMDGASASDIRHSWEDSRLRFPKGALHMRISDDQDEPRAVARYGIHGALAASALMFMLDGVPLLYNGMEVGDATESSDLSLFEKRTINWDSWRSQPLREIYRHLIALRKEYPCFRNDTVVWLPNSDESDLVTFMRLDDKDEFVVVINFSNRPIIGGVNVKDSPDFKLVRFPGMPDGGDGLASFHLNGFEWRIYHRVRSD